MTTTRPPRPFWVGLTAWIFLALGLAGWLRLAQTLLQWDFLSRLRLTFGGPLDLAAGGAAWGLIGLAAGLGLLTARPWAPWMARLGGVGIAALYWLDRWLVWRGGSRPSNLPFAALLSALCLIGLFWSLTRTNARRYFSPEIPSAPPDAPEPGA